MNQIKLIAKAKKRAAKLQELRQDPRYVKTLGLLKHHRLMDVRDVPAFRGQVFLADALWAAEIEPRVYELLPAVIARRPRIFAFVELPADLEQVVRGLKAGRPAGEFRGVAPDKYARWYATLGGKSGPPKVMRSFRMSQDDIVALSRLARQQSLSQSDVLHLAIAEYQKTI